MSNFYLVLYCIFWLIALVYFQKKTKGVSVGSFILVLFLTYAVSSLLLYNNSYHRGEFKELTLFPFIFEFFLLYVATLPIIQYSSHNIKEITPPNPIVLKIFTVVYIVSAITQIPVVTQNLSEGITAILINADAAEELYADRTAESFYITNKSDFLIANPLSVIFNIFSDFTIFLFYYYLTRPKRNKWIITTFMTLILLSILRSLALASRTECVTIGLTFLASFFLFKNYLDEAISRKVKRIILVSSFIVMIPFVAITNSRFSESDEGTLTSVERYIGECNLLFNNYAFDVGGTRHGERTSNVFLKMLGQKVAPDVRSLRAKYSNLHIDDTYFTTFAGDFVIDFGPITTSIMFVFFSFVFCVVTKPNKNKISFHKLILVYFALSVVAQGGMYLFSYSFSANWRIVAIVFTYFLFSFTSIKRSKQSYKNNKIYAEI